MAQTPTTIDHFENAFDLLWNAQSFIAQAQLELVIASMTMGTEFWQLWHHSRGERATLSIEESSFGGHQVITAQFRK